MLKRLIFVVIVLPIALLLLTLSVANRQDVSLNYNPFVPDAPGWQITAPMFWFLFGTFAAGLIAGSMATWFKQSRYRRRAREREAEVEEWRFKADKERERAQAMAQTLVEKRESDPTVRQPLEPRKRPMMLLGTER